MLSIALKHKTLMITHTTGGVSAHPPGQWIGSALTGSVGTGNAGTGSEWTGVCSGACIWALKIGTSSCASVQRLGLVLGH